MVLKKRGASLGKQMPEMCSYFYPSISRLLRTRYQHYVLPIGTVYSIETDNSLVISNMVKW